MSIFDDLEAEEARLEAILSGLDPDDWARASGAPGWSVADVVLHLAQSEEVLVASAGSGPGSGSLRDPAVGDSLDDIMEERVRSERSSPEQIFARWRDARRAALDLLRRADPGGRIAWATNPLSPTTLATTRLAEHWAHALDVTEPLGLPLEDTPRLRNVAWLGHRTLPYAFGLEGLPPADVRCELVGPDGDEWSFGPPEAESRIVGPGGEFCRVGARRLAPEQSSLRATGPRGADALRLLRNYAV